MDILAKAAAWVDADLAASTMPSSAPSIYVAALPFCLGLFGFALPEPWKQIILSIGILGAIAWLLFWSWRALRYLRSIEYLRRMKAVRESLSPPAQQLIFGQRQKSYNDAKLIAIKNCAIIGAICISIVVVYVVVHAQGTVVADRASAMVGGLGVFSLICFAFCIWQLATSPRQDAQIMRSWIPGIQNANPESIGVKLPDPSDPFFDLPTARYLATRMRFRRRNGG